MTAEAPVSRLGGMKKVCIALTYQNCRNGTEVTFVTIDGGGHVLYQGQQTKADTARMAWEFMKRFTK